MKKWLHDSERHVDQAPIDRLRQFPIVIFSTVQVEQSPL
jgi:hypothetical protein